MVAPTDNWLAETVPNVVEEPVGDCTELPPTPADRVDVSVCLPPFDMAADSLLKFPPSLISRCFVRSDSGFTARSGIRGAVILGRGSALNCVATGFAFCHRLSLQARPTAYGCQYHQMAGSQRLYKQGQCPLKSG